jgi:serine/threonine-protein kinase
MRESWTKSPDAEQRWGRRRGGAALEALDGSFASALRTLQDIQEDAVASANFWQWVHVTGFRHQLLLEAGERTEASRHAARLRQRLDALPTNPFAEDWAVAQDPVPRLLNAEYRGGLLSRAGHNAERVAWLQRWGPRSTRFTRPFFWVHAYAEYAETPEEATEALAALPRFGAVPPFRPLTATNFSIGRTYLLAGKVDEAIPYLTKATKACTPLSYPVPYVRSNLFLGMALAKKGDKPGACAAYAKVLKHWGKAKPRSVSAEQARKLSRELGCPAG